MYFYNNFEEHLGFRWRGLDFGQKIPLLQPPFFPDVANVNAAGVAVNIKLVVSQRIYKIRP